MARGIFFMLVGPAGVGKTTLLKRWREENTKLQRAISVTVRDPRPNEVDGVDYHFWTKEKFQEGIDKGLFLEYAEVHGKWYGTLKKTLEDSLTQGIDVAKDIDVQGAELVRNVMPYPKSVSTFVLAPNAEEMEKRLRDRGTEDPKSLERRLNNAKGEILYAKECDYVVWNDSLETGVAELRAIHKAEHCKTQRRALDLKNRGY